MRIKFKDLQLNQNGVKIIVADRREQLAPKIEIAAPRIAAPEISIPSIPNNR